MKEDKCEPRRVKFIATYLANEEVKCIEGPEQSPDLNCVENVLGFLKMHPRKRERYLKNSKELFQIFSVIRNRVPNSYFCDIIASMLRRIAMERKNRGGPTKCSNT